MEDFSALEGPGVVDENVGRSEFLERIGRDAPVSMTGVRTGIPLVRPQGGQYVQRCFLLKKRVTAGR